MCFTDRNSKTKWMKIRDNNPSNQGREVPKSRTKKNRKKRSLHKAPSASLSPISKRRRCREDARPRSRFIEEWSRDANLLPWKEGPRNWEMNVLPSLSKIDDRHPGEKTKSILLSPIPRPGWLHLRLPCPLTRCRTLIECEATSREQGKEFSLLLREFKGCVSNGESIFRGMIKGGDF